MSNSEGTRSANRPAWYRPLPALEMLRAAVLEFVSTPVDGRDPADRGQDLAADRDTLTVTPRRELGKCAPA